MKIDTGPLVMAIAFFLPNCVESTKTGEKPSHGGKIEHLPQRELTDWEGKKYGIHVGGLPGHGGMVYPYGTYKVLPGDKPTYAFKVVKPHNGQKIFRAGKHKATVKGKIMYEVNQNGVIVQKHGRKVQFRPQNQDILSNDGIHRYAAYEDGFRLYDEGRRTLIHQSLGKLETKISSKKPHKQKS